MKPTTSTSDRDRRKKKLWVVLGVGLLAAAVAGGGALSTLFTTISGNEFRAAVPNTEDVPEGALVRITGAAIDHEFDSSTFNHLVRASWVLENHGPTATTFDGHFRTVSGSDETLAAALLVQYGEVDPDGEVVGWIDGGTVADPTPFAEATGIDTINGQTQIPIEVRVVLEDPGVIASNDDDLIGQMIRVAADFTVSYLDPINRA